MSFPVIWRTRTLRRWRRSGLLANVSSLGVLRVVNYVVPLALLAYLTRTLGIRAFGLFAIAQSFAGYCIIGFEYGFEWSATRQVSRERGNTETLRRLVAEVTGAKVVVIGMGSIAALVVLESVTVFRGERLLGYSALAYAIVRAGNLYWFFQGMEKLTTVAITDGLARTGGVMAVIMVVHNARDAWLVLGLQAAVAAAASIVLGIWIVVDIGICLPTVGGIIKQIRSGFVLFTTRAASAVYTSGSTFLLGMVAAPSVVGWYAAADKVVRAVGGLAEPVGRAAYPRMARLVRRDRRRARRLLRETLVLVVVMGALSGLALLVCGPLVARAMFGGDFARSGLLLRIMAFNPLLIACGTILGYEWLVACGLESRLARILGGAAVAGLVLIPLLGRLFGAVGAAGAVVGLHAGILILMAIVSRQGLAAGAGEVVG